MKKNTAIFLCDKTGNMAKPWAEEGFTCICVDIQHSIRNDRVEKHGNGEIHFVWGDARSWVPPKWATPVFVASFPVCTNMAVSGARDFKKKGIPMMYDGLMLFNSCMQVATWSGAPFCIENPVGIIPSHFRKPDYYFHPWYYGDLWTKYTCLWTGNGFIMPEKEYTTEPNGVVPKIWKMPPGKDRADKRSETPMGFARAVFNANAKKINITT